MSADTESSEASKVNEYPDVCTTEPEHIILSRDLDSQLEPPAEAQLLEAFAKLEVQHAEAGTDVQAAAEPVDLLSIQDAVNQLGLVNDVANSVASSPTDDGEVCQSWLVLSAEPNRTRFSLRAPARCFVTRLYDVQTMSRPYDRSCSGLLQCAVSTGVHQRRVPIRISPRAALRASH
jgi:hypothetical protein